MIPRIIHQTWKDSEVPARWRHFQASWRRLHPAWEYRLWTDEDNRALVARHYPWFLRQYDALDLPIKRADAARYFILQRHGGVYVDLDFECLRPLDELLAGHSLVLGTEPLEHADVELARVSALGKLIGNAFLASVPRHPFWTHLFAAMLVSIEQASPLDATGPRLLTRAVHDFAAPETLTILPPETLYPSSKYASWTGETEAVEDRSGAAYAVHHWDGSWWQRSSDAHHDAFGITPLHLLIGGRIESSTTLPRRLRASTSRTTRGANAPLVSCLMVTRGRSGLARRAIECFQAQHYPRRELVIVDDDPDDSLARHVASLAAPDIRHVRLADEHLPLGTLRNLAVEAASGAYVAQWDDDDFYDPQRLSAQIEAIERLEADACVLARELMWWPALERLAVSRARLWEGSLVCDRRRLVPYAAVRRGEDTPVVAEVARQGRVALLDRPELYLYVCHAHNTFDAQHFEQHWQGASERFEGAHYRAMLAALARRMPMFSAVAAVD